MIQVGVTLVVSKQEAFRANQNVAVGAEYLQNVTKMNSTKLPNIFRSCAGVRLGTIAAAIHKGGYLRVLSVQILVHNLLPGDGGQTETSYSRSRRRGRSFPRRHLL